MKQKLQLILLTLLPLFSIGQTIELTGTVVDSIEQVGFPKASIELIKKDSTLLTTETDFDGNFKFEDLETGIYRLNIKAIGYPDIEVSELNLRSQRNNVKIELTNSIEPDPVEIDEIEWKYFTIEDSTGTIRCVKKED